MTRIGYTEKNGSAVLAPYVDEGEVAWPNIPDMDGCMDAYPRYIITDVTWII